MKPKLLGISAALMLMLTVAAGCTDKNRPNTAQPGAFGTTQQAQGTGTGVIVDTDGHIVTNNHVVTLGTNQVASNFVVDLADGRSNIPAKLVGREPAADLAILQISEPNLTPARW